MSALSAAASDEDGYEIRTLRARLQDAAAYIHSLIVERAKMHDAIKRLHASKNHLHTQHALCDLFDLCGLKNERPAK